MSAHATCINLVSLTNESVMKTSLGHLETPIRPVMSPCSHLSQRTKEIWNGWGVKFLCMRPTFSPYIPAMRACWYGHRSSSGDVISPLPELITRQVRMRPPLLYAARRHFGHEDDEKLFTIYNRNPTLLIASLSGRGLYLPPEKSVSNSIKSVIRNCVVV